MADPVLRGTITLVALLLIYITPATIALARKHQATWSILVVNLFLGWTILGWIVCLAWCVGPVRKAE